VIGGNPVPGVLGQTLRTVFGWERHLLKVMNLPYGLSLLGIAGKETPERM
jgi:hypothetical protein